MLDAGSIAKQAGATAIPFSVACYDEVGSTNDEVKRLIGEGAPEGSVVTSIIQTGGYGRQGRRWASPSGSLYLSLLLRPVDHGVSLSALPTLSLVVGLTVREVLAARFDDAVSVKWPNDVLCSQGKLCGISLEAIGGAVCIGIGINVFAPAEAPATSGAFPPAYLERLGADALGEPQRPPDQVLEQSSAEVPGCSHAEAPQEREHARNEVLEELAAHLLVELDRRYLRWVAEGFESFVGEYNDCAFLNGRTVGISSLNGDVVAAGRVARVDVRGNLVLVDDDGRERPIASGEAHIVLQ